MRPDAVVWKSDPPPNHQGLGVLGCATLFQPIPWVQDTQAAFLLLLMCGSTKANFWLRTVETELMEGFAARHDPSVWRCLSDYRGTPSPPWPCLQEDWGSRARTGSEVPPILPIGRAECGEEETPLHCRVACILEVGGGNWCGLA